MTKSKLQVRRWGDVRISPDLMFDTHEEAEAHIDSLQSDGFYTISKLYYYQPSLSTGSIATEEEMATARTPLPSGTSS